MRKMISLLVIAFLVAMTTANAQTAAVKYDTTALKAYLGKYTIASEGITSKVVIKEGKLFSIGEENDYEFVATAKEGVFELAGGSIVVTFIFDENKKATRAKVKTDDGEYEAVKEN